MPFLAQIAGDFATLVSPPTLGAIAINVRFLQKSGLHPALSAASVGVSQVAAFITYICLLFAFGIAAGTQADFTFDPPFWAVVGVAAPVVALVVVVVVGADGERRAEEEAAAPHHRCRAEGTPTRAGARGRGGFVAILSRVAADAAPGRAGRFSAR